MKKKKIPSRSEIKTKETWNLSLLFPNSKEWDKCLERMKKAAIRFSRHENKLKENIIFIHKVITEYLIVREEFSRLGAYATLSYSADLTNPNNQALMAKIQNAGIIYGRSTAFFTQELLSLSQTFLKKLSRDKRSNDYRQMILDIIRTKPHVLTAPEEKLLAEQAEYSHGFEKSFEALLNTDLKFGIVKTSEGKIELSNSTLGILLENRSTKIRKQAFLQYYQEIGNHKNVLSNLYASQVQKNCAQARIRKHPSALQAALHGGNIPQLIYTNLIDITRKNLPFLHRYYRLRKKIIPVKQLAVYDIYFNPYKPPKVSIKYEEAVKTIIEALQPLGKEYIEILSHGLLGGRWVDRYESKGKRSGAFSYPVYNKPPYILTNYKKESINSMFTLAHEAGHSMHSFLSNQNNSYAHFHYSIFEAEIASTLNEYLLYRHILEKPNYRNKKKYSSKHYAYLLLDKLHTFTSTFFRQVMFAEFEHNIHRYCEEGTPLTLDLFTSEYQKLSRDYYGKDVFLPKENGLVGLRIPHFYSSFYVYQYATGIACAYSLGKRIYEEYHKSRRSGKTAENTLKFLKSAGSRYPLQSLALAGVDFTSEKIIQEALDDYKQDIQLLW